MQEPKQNISKISLWIFGLKEKIEKNAGALFVFALLVFWLGVFLAQPVNLGDIKML